MTILNKLLFGGVDKKDLRGGYSSPALWHRKFFGSRGRTSLGPGPANSSLTLLCCGSVQSVFLCALYTSLYFVLVRVCVCLLYLQSCTVGGLFPHRCSRVSCGDRRFPAPDKMSRQLSSDFTNVKNAPNYLPRIFQALVGGEMASTANFSQSFVSQGKVTVQEVAKSNITSF